MELEQVRDAETIYEMLVEIKRLSLYDPLVRTVMDIADKRDLSAEERYVILSYYTLLERAKIQKMLLEKIQCAPVLPVVIGKEDNHG